MSGNVPGPPAPFTEQGASDAAQDRPRRSRRAWLGTFALLALMAGTGLLAAYMATPQPDEEALARPDDAGVVLAAGAPLSWDPAAIADTTSAQMLAQVFEGLTVLDAHAQVRPALAESWVLRDDGRGIDFTLREDLTFSDGSPLDAEDVRRSWLRVLDPGAPSPLASLLDDVAGAAAYARGEGGAEAVGVTADGRRLSVSFARPAAYFPALAAVPTLAVVPEDIAAQALGPSGSGRFVASGAYVPADEGNGTLRLRANPAYWAGSPPIPSIGVVTDAGGRSPVDVFEDEAVDWTPISPDDASWIRFDPQLGPQLRSGEDMVVTLLGFDTTRPPFDDPSMRRAVAMAVDWRRLARLDDPDGEPLTSIVPPGVTGRGDVDALLPHDPDGARALLAEAGYPGGEGLPVLTLATYGVGPVEAIAHELQRELGMRVSIELWPFDDHAALLDEHPPAMWTTAWSADYPHAHDFLGLLLRRDSSANEGGWANARFDALIAAAAATDDPAAQERAYEEAQAIVREEVPMLPMGYGRSWALSRDGLLGAAPSGVGILRFADLAWQR